MSADAPPVAGSAAQRTALPPAPGTPRPIGPYSQAVRVGNLLFCSGVIAMDPDSGALLGDGDPAAETRHAMQALGRVLAAAGTDLSQVVKTTIFLADLGDYAAVNEAYGEHFPSAPPARSAVEVSRLPRDARVEIEAIAVVA